MYSFFIFSISLLFSLSLSCRKDHISLLFFKTVLKSLKFGTQDFTDPGLLKIRCRCGFAFRRVSDTLSSLAYVQTSPECCPSRGLNPRTPAQQTGALPTELSRRRGQMTVVDLHLSAYRDERRPRLLQLEGLP